MHAHALFSIFKIRDFYYFEFTASCVLNLKFILRLIYFLEEGYPMKNKFYFWTLFLSIILTESLTSYVKAQSLPVPWLLAPNFNLLVNENPVSLNWQLTIGNIDLPAGDTYHLQVSKSSSFSSFELNVSGLIAKTYNFTATASTNYSWRVRVESGNNYSDWATGFFSTTADLHPGQTYTVTASAGSGGTISPSGTVSVSSGSNQAFTITPDAGYHLSNLQVDGSSVDSTTSYTFINVTANHTISASFAANSPSAYTITASAGSGGTISPSGSVSVTSSNNQAFTITPSSGYHLSNLLVDGSHVDSTTSYTFINVTANHTISATFAVNTSDTIVAAAGTGGSITPFGNVVVTSGNNQKFTITANGGYYLSVLLVDGIPVDSSTSYTFINVTSNHTISAYFTAGSVSTPTISFGTVSTLTGAIVSEPVNITSPGAAGFIVIQGKAYYDSTKLEFNYFDAGTGTFINAKNWFYVYNDASSSGTQRVISFIAAGTSAVVANGVLFNLGFKVRDLSSDSADVTGLSSEWIGYASDLTQTNFTVQNGKIHYVHHLSVSTLRGDANLDGTVSLLDATTIMNHLAHPFLSGQDSANADANLNGSIDIGDVHTIQYFVLNGSWPSPAILNSVVSGNLHIENVAYMQNSLIDLPIKLEGCSNVNSLQVEFGYNPSVISFNNFQQQVNNSGSLVYAKEISPGKVMFAFASANNLNGSINTGNVYLKFVNGIPIGGTSISVLYKLNNGEFKNGPTLNLTVTGIETNNQKNNSAAPVDLKLMQNYPNPFNPSTHIQFSIPKSSFVSLKVYNILGQLVKTLVNGNISAGMHTVQWNSDSENGSKAESGLYIYKITAGSYVQVKKMMLIK